MKIEHIPTGNDDTATILIEGLKQDLKLLHLTDTHVVESDDRDPDGTEHVERYGAIFAEHTPGGVPPTEIFQKSIDDVGGLDIDAAMLTGDIIHFPSYAGLEAIEKGVEALGVPYLYTQGNHDWFFPHLPWTDDTRRQYYPRFAGLTAGDPSFQVADIGGVRLIAVDNSTYQVSGDQLNRLRRELDGGQPSLLLVHVPLSVASLEGAVMERWKAPIVMGADEGWTAETREKWKVPKNEDATLECLEFLTTGPCDNLAAVFCGHVHFAHVDILREGCCQYVTAPGFEGRYRIVELKAL